MKAKAMGITKAAWIITVLAVLPCLVNTSTNTVKKAALDQGTVQMLSNILESLDAFRNDRLRDLEKIRLSAPAANGTTVARTDTDLYLTPKNSSVTDHIKALKEGIMGHNPVKKTFGYKVTVYTSPIGEDGKDAKPVVVTQYVGGDMMPDKAIKRKGEVEDLQESANQPELQRVRTSESIHVPVLTASDASGASEEVKSSAKDAAVDHNRKTEHHAFSDKGHQNAHSLNTKLQKGHDHEKHSAKQDEHHKETEKESHRHDTQAHDKGGATQQGIRERTEIEYYEREHFLDTEYDKGKTGHEKTSGVKEHEKHNDHDSHENKKTHQKEDSNGHKLLSGGSVGKAKGTVVDEGAEIHGGHAVYVPPYGSHHYQHPHVAHADNHKYKEDHVDKKEGHESSKHHLSEEEKAHREHNSEKEHQSEEKDSGYVDKDKGRRKEGYRERGYKITAEREYFLNDAHHDKGVSTHTSGAKLKDQEGAAHQSKEGERDRGFVKEEKSEEAHDAAYDTKERKFYDGEEHKEKVKEENNKAISVGQKEKQEEIVPAAPVGVNYIEPHHQYNHHVPYYPVPPIAYAPSDNNAQALVALPPANLKNRHTPQQQLDNNRHNPERNQKQPPLGGYDDDYEDVQSEGYLGHASYRKKTPSPLVSSIKENVRKDVHKKLPTYSKKETASNEENSVQFPDEKDREKYDNEESSEEQSGEQREQVIFPQDGRKPYHAEVKNNRHHDEVKNNRHHDEVKNNRHHDEVKNNRHHDDDHVYPPPKSSEEHILINLQDEEHQRNSEKEKYQNVPNRSIFQHSVPANTYPHHPTNADQTRYHNGQQNVYSPEIQSPDKMLRNIERSAYPQIQNAKLPSVSEILEEVSRFPQRKPNKQYIDAHRKTKENKNPQYSELHQLYQIGTQPYGQRGQREDARNNHRPRNHPNPHPQVDHRHQQGHSGGLTPLINLPQQQQHQRAVHQHQPMQQHQRQIEHLQQLQNQRTHQQQTQTTALDQLQQQTKPPFSPVVLLSRGPPTHDQNHPLDVWYTRH